MSILSKKYRLALFMFALLIFSRVWLYNFDVHQIFCGKHSFYFYLICFSHQLCIFYYQIWVSNLLRKLPFCWYNRRSLRIPTLSLYHASDITFGRKPLRSINSDPSTVQQTYCLNA